MKLTAKPLAVIVFVLFFGGIFSADLLGWWETAKSKKPMVYDQGEAAGQYDPADIRGSYTFGEIAGFYAIPLTDLAAAFRVPADSAAAFQVKTLESLNAGGEFEIGTGSVRLFVAWYRGLPYAVPEDTYLPIEAAGLLRAGGNLEAEQIAYLETHSVLPSGTLAGVDDTPAVTEATAVIEGQTTPTAKPQVESPEHTPPERTVTGKTTFQNLLDWGLDETAIEAACGFPLPANRAMLVKDATSENGGTFSTVKEALQIALNK
jgi:hypothetical protein